MSSRIRAILFVLLAVVLLIGASRVQLAMNRDRVALGLTRSEPLNNAPPVLAFTTVALGGFRGLIANALWIRASDLQDEDKFFEMAQLADWITKLEPHFVQVWLVQAWNMAYNISVKFKDYPDRWRWVKAGIELLRDDGLRFNENETLIYRELAWFFQHKMGQNLDDANRYYKQEWANEMAKVFAKQKPNLEELINPQTPDAKDRARLLRETYKMDPAFMKQVDERYGPLEWRLPEAHAVYWAAAGLKKAGEHPTRIKKDELITLRRVIYQSMQLSFQRGRMVPNPYTKAYELAPNLEIIPKTNAAYEQAMEEDAENREHISRGHRNFLRDAVYFLYENNRIADAAQWYKYLGTKYPDKWILEGNTNALPSKLTLVEYCVARVQEDINETSPERVTSAIEGYLANSYSSLVVDEPEHATGYKLMARNIWNAYAKKTENTGERVRLAPFEEIDRRVLNRLLDTKQPILPLEAQLRIRTILGLPLDTNAPPAIPPTNAPAAGTNAPSK